jgi:hypothetical protein
MPSARRCAHLPASCMPRVWGEGWRGAVYGFGWFVCVEEEGDKTSGGPRGARGAGFMGCAGVRRRGAETGRRAGAVLCCTRRTDPVAAARPALAAGCRQKRAGGKGRAGTTSRLPRRCSRADFVVDGAQPLFAPAMMRCSGQRVDSARAGASAVARPYAAAVSPPGGAVACRPADPLPPAPTGRNRRRAQQTPAAREPGQRLDAGCCARRRGPTRPQRGRGAMRGSVEGRRLGARPCAARLTGARAAGRRRGTRCSAARPRLPLPETRTHTRRA